MSSTALVSVSTAIVRTGKKKTKAELPPEPPHIGIEVVTEEDVRHEEQLKPKATSPKDYLKNIPDVRPPLTRGAEVSCETLLGFLSAIESVLPDATGSPLLEAAKFSFEDSETPRLVIEAGTESVWTAVALEARQTGDAGFSMVVPVRRARNVLRALRAHQDKVVIGGDSEGVCIGPHTIPFSGGLDEFPSQPLIQSWQARAVMPAYYFGDICRRVLPARSREICDLSLQRVLLDFEHCEIDGEPCVLATAVATDGRNRYHIMRLPHTRIQMRGERTRALPPTCSVSAGFFQYLHEIVDGKVVGLEIGSDQVVAKGVDFVTVATVSDYASKQMGDLTEWRKYDISYPGYWLVDRVKLQQSIAAIDDDTVLLLMDGLREKMRVLSPGHRSGFRQDMEAQCFNGPSIASVTLYKGDLLEAIECCDSGLIRVEIAHRDADQDSLPVVLRGEDEQFKAVLQPQQ